MATSLYELSVRSYRQSLIGVKTVLAKGREYAEAEGLSLDEIADTRLRDDMLPFRFQVQAVRHQSIDTITAFESGEFGPPSGMDPDDYTELQAIVDRTLEELDALDADAVNAHAGKTVVFRMPGLELPFTAENFVLSFSLPNLYFHATTAYDILRIKGVPLSKRDFLGPLAITR